MPLKKKEMNHFFLFDMGVLVHWVCALAQMCLSCRRHSTRKRSVLKVITLLSVFSGLQSLGWNSHFSSLSPWSRTFTGMQRVCVRNCVCVCVYTLGAVCNIPGSVRGMWITSYREGMRGICCHEKAAVVYWHSREKEVPPCACVCVFVRVTCCRHFLVRGLLAVIGSNYFQSDWCM